ncbi:NAD-dependent epimerase/dehydratase family protein [Bdellovibrio sp. HCB290]|uniref:NAD-dependent epimerase/dehydratase family protein n=1 Tax=Bdellovibrio sp. HCB290 TaxID=3394356 RepID=UPI0039B5CBDC
MASQKVLLLGKSGLIGNALAKKLTNASAFHVLAPSSQELNLLNATEVEEYFSTHRPDIVINASGKSGGVAANVKMPADFSLENTIMSTSVLNASLKYKASKLVQFIPACVYPLNASLPYRESSILSGPIEESSKHFAVAKLNALSMAEAMNRQYGTKFISVIPSNVYGPQSREASENSHVIPSLLKRMEQANSTQAATVEIWGDGDNQRDFLHADDLAAATMHILQYEQAPSVINVGSNELTSIAELATLIQSHVGFSGSLSFVNNGLSGAKHKYLDTSVMSQLGWKAQIPLKKGITTLRS